ncbi:MAG: hypothetical protein PVJ86_13230, partial [Phycisphaerales bacterium]
LRGQTIKFSDHPEPISRRRGFSKSCRKSPSRLNPTASRQMAWPGNKPMLDAEAPLACVG